MEMLWFIIPHGGDLTNTNFSTSDYKMLFQALRSWVTQLAALSREGLNGALPQTLPLQLRGASKITIRVANFLQVQLLEAIDIVLSKRLTRLTQTQL